VRGTSPRRLDELAAHVNERLRFRIRAAAPEPLLRRASGLLDSEHSQPQDHGPAMCARTMASASSPSATGGSRRTAPWRR